MSRKQIKNDSELLQRKIEYERQKHVARSQKTIYRPGYDPINKMQYDDDDNDNDNDNDMQLNVVPRVANKKNNKPFKSEIVFIKKPQSQTTNTENESQQQQHNDNNNNNNNNVFDKSQILSLTVPSLDDDDTSSSSDEDEEIEQQRARAKALSLKRQEEQLQQQQQQTIDIQQTSISSSSSSEYETDTSDSDSDEISCEYNSHLTARPVYVSRKNRSTVEKDQIEDEEKQIEIQKIKRKKERKKETIKIVVDTLMKEEIDSDKDDSDLPDDSDPDSDDVEAIAAEFKAWKLRELKRYQRDKTAEDERRKEMKILDDRRKMNDIEILQDNERRGIHVNKNKNNDSGNKKVGRYYHKGSFFTEELERDYKDRDFQALTAEDKIDKSILPKIMQVRNFGKKGNGRRFKGLKNEDTTYVNDK